MKLLIINGSPRKIGRTGIATRYIARIYGADLFDLSKGEVPLYTGDKTQYQIQAVSELKEKVSEADGIILASPEYHNGMSGVLKNALDFLGSEQFLHKPVALLAVAGGGKGGINALNNMRTVMRGVYANTIPRQLILDPECFDYDKDGLNKKSSELVSSLVNELTMYVHMSLKLPKVMGE